MGVSSKTKRHLSELVKKLRGNASQSEFADKVGVKQNVISRWEDSDSSIFPAAHNYARLGNLADEHEDRKWLWEQAGIDMQALDKFADERMAGKSSHAPDFIDIPLILNESITIPVASRLLTNRAATRFAYSNQSESPIEINDIVLIDTRMNSFKDAEEGELFAIMIRDGGREEMCIGSLAKQGLGSSGVQFALETRYGGVIPVAMQAPNGAVDTYEHVRIAGKVVGWIMNPEQHTHKHKHRRHVKALSRMDVKEYLDWQDKEKKHK